MSGTYTRAISLLDRVNRVDVGARNGIGIVQRAIRQGRTNIPLKSTHAEQTRGENRQFTTARSLLVRATPR